MALTHFADEIPVGHQFHHQLPNRQTVRVTLLHRTVGADRGPAASVVTLRVRTEEASEAFGAAGRELDLVYFVDVEVVTFAPEVSA